MTFSIQLKHDKIMKTWEIGIVYINLIQPSFVLFELLFSFPVKSFDCSEVIRFSSPSIKFDFILCIWFYMLYLYL